MTGLHGVGKVETRPSTAQVDATGKRRLVSDLLHTGAGSAASTAAAVLLPLSGRLFLSDQQFAVWALLASVATVGLIFDMGGPAVTSRRAALGDLSRRDVLEYCALTNAGTFAVGLVAAAIWVPYTQHSGLQVLSPLSGELCLLLTILGCATRSVIVILSAVALGHSLIRRRNAILLTQAVLQALSTVAFLLLGLALWSFGLGLLVSGVATLSFAWRTTIKNNNELVPVNQAATYEKRREIWLFFRVQGVVTTIGLILTQGDRWAIGFTGGAAWLSQYEIAWRLASVPRTIVSFGSSVLVPRAVGLTRAETSQLLSRTMTLTSLVVVPSMIGVSALYVLAASSSSALPVYLALGLIAAHAVNGLTAPGTMLGNGAGRPQVELPYLLLASGILVTGWVIAFALDSPLAAAASVICALAVGSTFFLATQRRLLNSQGVT